MGFLKKTWADRISQYPNRFTSTDESGVAKVVTLERNNGEVSEGGDAFSAQNMNDLEGRIADALEFLSEYQLSASGWVDSGIELFPFKYEIASSEYDDDSAPIWDIKGAGDFMTKDEQKNAGLILVAYFMASGITLYATKQPEVNLVLRVKGV